MRIKAVVDIGQFTHGFKLPAGATADIEDSKAQGAVHSGAAISLEAESIPPTPPPAAEPPPAKPAEGTEGDILDTPKPRRKRRRESSEEKPDHEVHS